MHGEVHGEVHSTPCKVKRTCTVKRSRARRLCSADVPPAATMLPYSARRKSMGHAWKRVGGAGLDMGGICPRVQESGKWG
eukprot:244924-Chlamydomonas_euryale.AAC.2